MNNQIMSNKIKKELNELRTLEKKIKAYISKAPEGKLRCAHKGKSFQYYIGKVYLGKDKKKMIEDIANREYQEKLLPKVQKKIRMLERCEECLKFDFSETEKVYLELIPARKNLVNPLIRIKSDYIKRWQETDYERWEITDDNVRGRYFNVKNERVRSKSEKIIADELTRYGIPYRYEYPLQLNEGGRIVQKRPDFIALNPNTLEEFVIEHLGMMDSDRYYNNVMNKLYIYEKNGYMIGVNLLIFHETSDNPVDTKIVDEYIEHFLL